MASRARADLRKDLALPRQNQHIIMCMLCWPHKKPAPRIKARGPSRSDTRNEGREGSSDAGRFGGLIEHWLSSSAAPLATMARWGFRPSRSSGSIFCSPATMPSSSPLHVGSAPRQRFVGHYSGRGAAVLLRIVFTVGLQYVLELPWLRLVGGLLLL